MSRYYLLFLSIILFVSCKQRVWDNPYDPNSEIDRSILILPVEQTIDMNEEIVLDVQFNMYSDAVFAVSMVIDYDSTIIQPINFANGEVFGTENISFATAEVSKIFLTISFLQGTDPDYRSGLLCSFDFHYFTRLFYSGKRKNLVLNFLYWPSEPLKVTDDITARCV